MTHVDSNAVASNFDINNLFKVLVTKGLAQIPEVGGIISGLVALLWPDSSPSVWDQIKAEVEALVERKISDAVYSIIRQKLVGLGEVLKQYLAAVTANPPDREHIRTIFTTVDSHFVHDAPEFQNPDFAWPLLPLFATFTNLHMTLLRDCVIHGTPDNWGWDNSTYQQYVQEAKVKLKAYQDYASKVMDDQYNVLEKDAPTSPGQHNTDIWNYWQSYRYQTTLGTKDYMQILSYLDPFVYPDPVPRLEMVFDDVYSVAYGTADNFDNTARGWAGKITTPFSKPLSSMTSIYMEYYDKRPRIADVHYSNGQGPLLWGGPGRIDKTPIIANRRAGETPYTLQLPVPAPDKMYNIQKVQVWAGSIPEAVQFLMDDGSAIAMYMAILNAPMYTVEVPGRMLSTLSMWTVSTYYHYDLACIIFGFSFDLKHTPPTASRLLYISSVREPSPPKPEPVDPEWQKAREDWWHHIKDNYGKK